MTCRSFSFLIQFPLWPQKTIRAPFGKEQNCAANCCPEKRKEKTSPIAAQQRKSRIKKKNTITYDKNISGTVDVAFIGTARSWGEKVSIYTLWHIVSFFVEPGWENQQHWDELLLLFALKQPRDGVVWEQGSNAVSLPCTQRCRPGSLWAHMQAPSCPAGLLGILLCAPNKGRPIGGANNVFPNTCNPMGQPLHAAARLDHL